MLLHILQRKNYFKWLLDQHIPTLLSGIGSEDKESCDEILTDYSVGLSSVYLQKIRG